MHQKENDHLPFKIKAEVYRRETEISENMNIKSPLSCFNYKQKLKIITLKTVVLP